jgi:hypothetical protein
MAMGHLCLETLRREPKTHTARGSVLTPRAASSAVSFRNENGPERMRCRSQSALAPDRVRFLCRSSCQDSGSRSRAAASSTWNAGRTDPQRLSKAGAPMASPSAVDGGESEPAYSVLGSFGRAAVHAEPKEAGVDAAPFHAVPLGPSRAVIRP